MRSVSVKYVAPVLVVLIGCTSNDDHSEFPADDAKIIAIDLLEVHMANSSDVELAIQNARNADQSVMFVCVRWSMDSLMATFPFAQFMLDYYSSHPNSKLLFHYIDCTSISDGYAPLKEIPGWRKLEEETTGSLLHGYGEVVWLKDGRVLRVEPVPPQSDLEFLGVELVYSTAQEDFDEQEATTSIRRPAESLDC
jgi:hypothetical protein